MPKWVSVQICERCWRKANPFGEPHRLTAVRETSHCRDCDQLTTSGIYVRREESP